MSTKSQSWSLRSLSKQDPGAGLVRHHPTELMLRALLSKHYAANAPALGPGTRVLDIGVMYVNNLVPFHDRGCICHGIEINEEMAAIAKSFAERLGVETTISVGSNRHTGYPDRSFDLVLSVNTVHYEDDTSGLRAALREFHRVLDENGRLFIVTAGPSHHIREHARRLGENRYEITADDFRRGQVMAYFEDEAQLAALVGELFSKVETGRQIEQHPKATLDYFYALAVR